MATFHFNEIENANAAPRISVSVTMHVNSGVRTLNPASCLTLWGVADAGVATQHGVVTIRTATALPEKEGVEIDSNPDGGLRPTGLASLDRQSKPNMPLQWLPMVIITY